MDTTRYYWRVSASNAVGTSDYSEVWCFTTGLSLPLPTQVQLVDPPHAAVIASDSVVFTWMESEPAVTAYWFENATDSLFTSSFDSTLADTSMALTSLIDGQDYWWRVRARNATGWGPFSAVRSYRIVITDVDEKVHLPLRFGLSQNYPNPFNPATVIRYSLPVTSYVMLKMYNVLGQEVATLVNAEMKPGSYEVTWDASGMASGVYLYRLTAGSFVETKKLVLMR
jgi:hypothetical protein